MPTVVNNVETLVNVPRIILNGVEWFREVGTEKSLEQRYLHFQER